jgi:Tfp pilus assembly protein PilF
LAALLADSNDEEGIARCQQHLNSIRGGGAYAAMVRADVALRQNDFMTARSALEQVLSAMPNSTRTLESLLQMDILQHQMGQAEVHARRLLNLNAQSAIGNLIMGELHYAKNEFDLAEDSYRVSLKTKRSAAALNDLAWLLQEKKEYVEALKLAKEVVARDETMSQGWDTLGVVLMRSGQMDESAKALEKSLSIAQSDPGVFLHLAELRALRGEKDRALELVQMLYGKADLLSAADQQKLNEISRNLSAGLPKKTE